MGDISAEPSMEDILSSIKRIIAEEDSPAARRRSARHATPSPGPEADDEDEVLELSDPMPQASPAPQHERAERDSEREPAYAPEPQRMVRAAAPEPAKGADPIVSSQAADATRGALQSLSRLMVKPEPQSDGTLEGLVREMLRPMLKDWLDANLPHMVEAMVAKEIARISGQGR